MGRQEPTTQTMKISEVKNRLSSLVNEVYRKETRVLGEKAGIPVTALVSAEDLKQLARFDAQCAERRRVVDAMWGPFRGGLPAEEIAHVTASAVAEVKQEWEAERETSATRP